MLIQDNKQLQRENAGLINRINQQNIELNSAKSEIITLKAENTRQANSSKQLNATIDLQTKVVASLQDEIAELKRCLKSCDGNLNAVTKILFKTNDRQQVFPQTSSEPLDLIVVVDGLKLTASDLVISSPRSMIKTVNYANGSVVNNKATELYIDHQQTLFLPTNLGQRFPALQVLVVTSAGFMQIDPSVIGFFNNFKVLNLTSNKLQEIQPGIFDQLKLIESLDLSSNNLKSLTASAITGLEKLRILNLAGNRLQTISSNLFEPLKVLKSVDLSNNDCINLSFPKVPL